MIIYAAPETPMPVGGVRVLARHVELLTAAGFDAALWCPTPDYSYPWFSYNGKMLSGEQISVTADDLLVLPEVPIQPDQDPAPGARKVIFNQNHFLTFLAWSGDGDYPGWTPHPSIWAVSNESVQVLSEITGELITLIPNTIDTDLFRPRERRLSTVALMPRKRPPEAALLKRLLPDRIEVTELSGVPEEEVAEVLGSVSVFVALGAFESFGLPVAEALASGCLVVGYPAGGGEELFDAPGAFRVPDARPAMLAAEILAHVDTPADEVRAAGRKWVHDRHNAAITTQALVTAVKAAMTKPGGSAEATHPTVLAAEFMEVLRAKFA